MGSSSNRGRSSSDKRRSDTKYSTARSRSRDNDGSDRHHHHHHSKRDDSDARDDRRHKERHRHHRDGRSRSRSHSRSRMSGATSSRGKRSRSRSNSSNSDSISKSRRSSSRSRGEHHHTSSHSKSAHRHRHHDRASAEREHRYDRERYHKRHRSREKSSAQHDEEHTSTVDRVVDERRRVHVSTNGERYERTEQHTRSAEPNTPDTQPVDANRLTDFDRHADRSYSDDARARAESVAAVDERVDVERHERVATSAATPLSDDASPLDRQTSAMAYSTASDASDVRSGRSSVEPETQPTQQDTLDETDVKTAMGKLDAKDATVVKDGPMVKPVTKDAATFRFEHLEAVRNVQLITRNEYPLAHLQRERLVQRDYDAKADDDDDDSAVCYCKYPDATDKDKRRCDDVSCLNYATYVECNSQCPAREYCCNQRLQQPELFPTIEAFKARHMLATNGDVSESTEHKGFGVRTTEEIMQSRIIGEYVGEIIDQKELTLRLKSAPRNELNFYYLLLEPSVYIDARNKGSFTRFVNHSCEPNCKTEKWTVRGETRIAVIALRDISAGEELTFDYQWKSLGSRQIKCFCESANCKGVIGTEGDTVKDDTPKGLFREPNRAEIGAALVNRRIRIFKSPDDHSMYYIATIQSYDKSDGVYEVNYQDMTNVDVDDDDDDDSDTDSHDGAFGAADNSSGAKSGDRFVKLSELDWQIFVELDGMSEDQIEKEVFSIPKRRVAVESREPSPKSSSDATTTADNARASPSNSSLERGGLVTGRSISNAPLAAFRKNANGESVDADGNVITTKLLIKGVSTKCDIATLRQLFVSDDRRHHHHRAPAAAAGATASLVVDLDLFFFDDSGWALVEFPDATTAGRFQRTLNNRPLLGNSLRIYHAGRKEVETFMNAKLRRRHIEARRAATAPSLPTGKSADDPTAAAAAALDRTAATPSSMAATRRAAVPYCFGRKLNWQVSVEQMEESPSRRAGISPSLEQSLRTKCVKIVQRLTKRLHLDRADATSAIVALARYYTFHAMNVRNVEFLAAALLHVVLKAHARRFSWTAFVSEVYAAKTSSSTSSSASSADAAATKQLADTSDEFCATERQLLSVERELLDGLRYDLSSDDPYTLLDSLIRERTRATATATPAMTASSPLSTVEDTAASPLLQASPLRPARVDRELPPPEVQREARQLVSDVLRLPIWVQTPAECVVLSIVYVSAAVTQALKERVPDASVDSNSNSQSSQTRPTYLPVLDARRNELESLMLLECALSLCDSLKDRWLRLEKLAKASHRDDDVFDMEAFAVTRTKPVELVERIAQLLKTWVDAPSSASAPLSYTAYNANGMTRSGSTSVPPDCDVVSGSAMASQSTIITLSMIGKPAGAAMRRSADSRSTDRDDSVETVSAASVVPQHVVKTAGGGSSSVFAATDRLHASDVTGVELIRKRAYLGAISKDVPFDIAGRRVYVQTWPTRDHEPPFSPADGSISTTCMRELSAANILSAKWSCGFVKLLGIVFPDEKKPLALQTAAASSAKSSTGHVDAKRSGGTTTTSDVLDVDMSIVDIADAAALAATASTPSTTSRLDSSKHYLAFEQPLHLYSGIFDAKVAVPMPLKLRAIHDMLTSLAVCHELDYVHRGVAASHLFVFKHSVKLGGYHAVRKTTSASSSSSSSSRARDTDAAYEMTESERKELCVGSSVAVAAPEVLLGDGQFTWRSDIWSAGCVALAILFDNPSLLLGADAKVQLDKIFRLCGTPSVEWSRGAALPLYRLFKPLHEYKPRLCKTLSEVRREKQHVDVSDAALALLERMLQLDPLKRASARELLGMELFADVASPTAPLSDFRSLPETFAAQQKKLLAHLRTSKPKRRRPASASSDFAPSGSSSAAAAVASAAATTSSHHRSSSMQSHSSRSRRPDSHAVRTERQSRHSSGSSASKSSRSSATLEIASADDVPLPAFFHAPTDAATGTSSSGSSNSKHVLSPGRMMPPRPEKRAKLGWGMGLHSDKTA